VLVLVLALALVQLLVLARLAKTSSSLEATVEEA
jgi:hypothetical protein